MKFFRRFKSAPDTKKYRKREIVCGTREYLAGHFTNVTINRDIYTLLCIYNDVLTKELRSRYDGKDCQIEKRERAFRNLIKSIDTLWSACRDAKDMCDAKRFLIVVSKVFYDNAQRYVDESIKNEDEEFTKSIYLVLAENEFRSAWEIDRKYIPHAQV